MRIVMIMIFLVASGWAECNINDHNTTLKCIGKNLETFKNNMQSRLKNYKDIEKNLSLLQKNLLLLKKNYDGVSKKIDDTKDKDNVSEKFILKIEKVKLETLSLSVNNMLLGDSKDDIFDTSLILGIQLQPSYSDDNKNEGFNHSTFYAMINIDSRFGQVPGFSGPWNFGVNLEYLGTPVERNSTISLSPTSFNQVSNTFQSTIYGSVSIYQVSPGSEIGLLGQYGFLNREITDQNESTINNYFGGGLEYVYSGMLSPFYKPNSMRYNKSYPKAKISIVYRKYDFFAGERRVDRWVLNFEYRIGDFLLGFNANTGANQDAMYLKFAIVKPLDKISNFFWKK